MSDRPQHPAVSKVFLEIAQLAGRLGLTPLNARPGLTVMECDEATGGHFRIAVNGHREPIQDHDGEAIAPFHAHVEYNGWPCGVLNPGGGTLLGSPNSETSMEDRLIAALRRTHPTTEATA